MIKVNIFRHQFEIPKDNKVYSFEFQSLGFLFDVRVKKVDLLIDNKYQIASIRLTVNKSITASIDVAIHTISGKPLSVEYQLMKRLFSNKQSLNLIECIDD